MPTKTKEENALELLEEGNTCQDCAYYTSEEGYGYGECRLNPPTVISNLLPTKAAIQKRIADRYIGIDVHTEDDDKMMSIINDEERASNMDRVTATVSPIVESDHWCGQIMVV